MKFVLAGITGLAVLAATPSARALAQIGGGFGLDSVGGCNVTRMVPPTTRQDALALSATTGCNGGSASGTLHAETATGSVGLAVTASGSGAGAVSASGFVSLNDLWELHVPAGQPVGYFDVGLVVGLEGSVAPGSVAPPPDHAYLSYVLSLGEFGLVASYLSPAGSITGTGPYSQIHSAMSRFFYYGPTVPLLIDVSLYLGVNQLQSGAVAFDNTASAWIDLPPGFSVTTSSGLPVVFAPIPEPATGPLLALGVIILGAFARWRPAWPAAAPRSRRPGRRPAAHPRKLNFAILSVARRRSSCPPLPAPAPHPFSNSRALR